MKILTPLGLIPTDKVVSTFDPPYCRAPSQAGYGPIFKACPERSRRIGQVFKFRANQGSVSLIVVFIDQPVPDGFLRSPGNCLELEGTKLMELSRYGRGRDSYLGLVDPDRSFGVVDIIANTGR
jgi:hypothetical protein